jgi:uncharacterized RmlC-like cupin family protein
LCKETTGRERTIVTPEGFDRDTSQTPGSERVAAISARTGITTPMWAGLFVIEPGGRTAIHHHGEQDKVAYVLAGEMRVHLVVDQPNQRFGGSAVDRCLRLPPTSTATLNLLFS